MPASYRRRMHPARRRPTSPRRVRRRSGDTIIEALVACLLLTVGGLSLLGVAATLAREERRATARRRAASVLESRLATWSASPCGPVEGSRRVGGLEERWRTVLDADSVEQLVDSVRVPNDAGGVADGVVAVRGCSP